MQNYAKTSPQILLNLSLPVLRMKCQNFISVSFWGWGGGQKESPRVRAQQKKKKPKRLNLVSKCIATRRSVAAPPPGARQSFGGLIHLRHPSQASGKGCERALLGGCSCDTPATHWKHQNEPRQGGVATPWSATEGGCSVCAT